MRRIGKLSLALLSALLGVATLCVATLAYPAPLFAHDARLGSYRVYSDEPITAEVARVIEDTARRVEAMEHEPPPGNQRVYLCSPKRFSFFALLTRMNPESLAIGLSAMNETFVSVQRVRLFAEQNAGVFRHTRFEGNMAEVIAHEIAHFNSIRAVGYRVHLGQPLWKSEGWAEYQANIAAIRADPEYNLGRRIDLLLDDGYWSGSSWARAMWESQLLVEFLCEVKSYGLTNIIAEDVTQSSTRKQMMAWYRSQ